jgi:hypothetical protein
MIMSEGQLKQWASAEHWIQSNLQPAIDAPGLDGSQIESRWRWCHLKEGGTMFGCQPTVDGFPDLLRRYGYEESSTNVGGETYAWWSAEPKGWLAAYRRVPRKLRKGQWRAFVNMQPWQQEQFSSFGEAQSWLQFEFSAVSNCGAPCDEFGDVYIGDDAWGAWKWTPAGKDPFGPGVLGMWLDDVDLAKAVQAFEQNR